MKYLLSVLFFFVSCAAVAGQSNVTNEGFNYATDTTPIYRTSKSHRIRNVFVSTEFLLIDHADASIATPDGIPVDFEGPGLSYVVRTNTSLRISHHLDFIAATQSGNLFPSAEARVMITGWHGLIGSFGYRRDFNPVPGGDGSTPHVDMLGARFTKRIKRRMDLSVAFDSMRSRTFNTNGATYKPRVNLHATFTF